MQTDCCSFPPAIGAGCRVLILGSMPGDASIRAGQYYAHKQNAFWQLSYAVWDQNMPDSGYESRLSFLRAHSIGLWDVAKTCRRKGSSDAAIRDVTVNDFTGLFAKHPSIHTVCFNGRTAWTLFQRHALCAAGNRRLILLPSSSPAHTMPFSEKLAAWRAVREAVE